MSFTAIDLGVKIFADGAERADILTQYKNRIIRGFTTNPTLMRKAGLTDYEGFAREFSISSQIAPSRSRYSPTTLTKCTFRLLRSDPGVRTFMSKFR